MGAGFLVRIPPRDTASRKPVHVRSQPRLHRSKSTSRTVAYGLGEAVAKYGPDGQAQRCGPVVMEMMLMVCPRTAHPGARRRTLTRLVGSAQEVSPGRLSQEIAL
jgi:hypothetical protein